MSSGTVFAIVIAAVSVAGSMIGIVLRAVRKQYPRRQRRSNPVGGIFLCAIGFIFGTSRYAIAIEDQQTFDAAPSCAQSRPPYTARDGMCRFVSMEITRIYESRYRSSRKYHLVLSSAMVRNLDVVFGAHRSGNVIVGFLHRSDRDANVEFFRGFPVVVQTASGVLETSEFPAQRELLWGVVALLCGGVGVIVSFQTKKQDWRFLLGPTFGANEP